MITDINSQYYAKILEWESANFGQQYFQPIIKVWGPPQENFGEILTADIIDQEEFIFGIILSHIGVISKLYFGFQGLKSHFSEHLFWLMIQIWDPLNQNFGTILTVGIKDQLEYFLGIILSPISFHQDCNFRFYMAFQSKIAIFEAFEHPFCTLLFVKFYQRCFFGCL